MILFWFYSKEEENISVNEYCKKYRSRILIMGLFVFLIHGAKLNSNIIGIDTEDIIRLQGDFYGGWLHTGRQGLVFVKGLLGSLRFNPYFAGMAALVFLWLGVAAFFLLWEREAGEGTWKSIPFLAGAFLWVSHPVVTEQLYFSLQSMEICLGVSLTALALYLSRQAAGKKSLWRGAAAALLLVCTFSMYQVFVALYIFGAVTLLLLQYGRALADNAEAVRPAGGSGAFSQSGAESLTGRRMLLGIIPYIGVFMTAFLVNTIVTAAFFGSSSYLEGQIMWGRTALKDNLLGIVHHIGKVCTGLKGIHFNPAFGLLCLLFLILTVRFACRLCKGRRGEAAVWLFLSLALLACPFLMTLVIGSAPAVRSQLVLPAAAGFMAYLDLRLLSAEKGRFIRYAAVAAALVCAAGVWLQAQTTLRLYYTDACRYEQDVALGRELIPEIVKYQGGLDRPLVVVGRREFAANNACLAGEVIGRSFFDYDTFVEPMCYWSSRRIIGFLHTLGFDCRHASQEGTAAVVEYSAGMPSWPAEGSVQVYEDMVVVKLSELWE